MSVDDRLREELGALLDGELPAEREAELRARLERDPELAREFEALRRTVDAVRGLARESAPPELRARVAAGRARRAAPIVWPRWGLAAAAVLLVAVGAALLALRGDRPAEPGHQYEATLPSEDKSTEPQRKRARIDDAKNGGREEKEGVLRALDGLADADEARTQRAGARAPAKAEDAAERRAEEPARPPAETPAEEAAEEPAEDLERKAPADDAMPQPETAEADRDAADQAGYARGQALLAAVARDGRLAAGQRREYLTVLAALDQKAVDAHVASLPQIRAPALSPAGAAKDGGAAAAKGETKGEAKGETKGETKGERKAGTPALTARARKKENDADLPPLEVRLTDRLEAEALAKVLRTAYARPKKASPRGAAASTSLELGAAAPRSLDVVVDLTALEREQVRNWLALLDAAPRPPGAPAAVIQRRDTAPRPGADAGEGGRGAAPKPQRTPVKIRLLFD